MPLRLDLIFALGHSSIRQPVVCASVGSAKTWGGARKALLAFVAAMTLPLVLGASGTRPVSRTYSGSDVLFVSDFNQDNKAGPAYLRQHDKYWAGRRHLYHRNARNSPCRIFGGCCGRF